VVFLEVVLQAFGGQSHPIASWAIGKFEHIFTPVGVWFTHAQPWAGVAMIMVLSVPGAIMMTWALNVAGMGLKPRYWAVWLVLFWIALVSVLYVFIDWARNGGGFGL
jgi:hypothetical protein